MARPERHDADYFPFFVKDGKTLYILESKYGLQGIGFFTNLMRFLTRQPDHYVCVSEESDRLYFFAQLHSPIDIGMDMLSTMAKTGKIDAALWNENMVIVSKDLLKSLEPLYLKRKNKIPNIDDIRVIYAGNLVNDGIEDEETIVNGVDNTQSKVKKSKVKLVESFLEPETPKPELLNPPSEKEPDALMNELREVTEDIGTLMPEPFKQRQMMTFVEANIRKGNHNAILHCMKSLQKQLRNGEAIEKPRAYLEAAMKIEDGKHNAEEYAADARKRDGPMTKQGLTALGRVLAGINA